MDPVRMILGDAISGKKKTKRKCKYCGKVHLHAPFTDCHNPSEPLPDDLGSAYRSFGYEDDDDDY